jgi:hypothetical protein
MNNAMEAILAVLGLSVLLLVLCVFYLSHRISEQGKIAVRWAETCMTQTCAFNEDQRSYMRDKMALETRVTPDPVPTQAAPRPWQPVHPADAPSMPIPYEG